MAAVNAKLMDLTPDQRQTLESWLLDFDHSWDERRLALRVRELPPAGDPLRLPALIEMVKIDLEKQWQQGRRACLEAYLRFYPDLGTTETVPADLIQAEYEVRRQFGVLTSLDEFARRFPHQVGALRQLLDQAPSASGHSDPKRPSQGTAAPNPSTQPHTPPAGASTDLPEQFGRYRILKKLGQGGMGSVYLAQDSQLDRRIALKVPHFTAADGSDVLERFYREARSAATIEHPNICPIYDVGQMQGIHYLTMAYVEGRSLAEVIHGGKPVTPVQAATVVRRLALALHEAHKRGVIHRDLKPANIMINKMRVPVIMDFGLARRANKEDVRLTKSGSIVGTPAYMPPEQVTGDLDAMGPACDIYSLGVILYELLTCKLPFEGSLGALMAQILTQTPRPPSVHRPDLDPRFDVICLKALAKKPQDRHASMGDLAAALSAVLQSSQPAGHPSPRGQAIPIPGAEELLQVLPVPEADFPMALPAIEPPNASWVVPLEKITDMQTLVPTSKHPPVIPVAKTPPAAAVPRARPATPRPPAMPTAPRPAVSDSGAGGSFIKWTLIILVLGLAAGGTGWLAYTVLFSPSSYVKEGKKLANRGDHDGAIAQYTKALKRDDKLTDAYVGRAEAYFRKGDYDLTINDCTQALLLDSSVAEAYAYRGGAYNRLGEFVKSVDDCDEALRRNARLAVAYAFRGGAHSNLGDAEKALKDLNEAIVQDSQLALAYAYRSVIHGNSGKYDQALTDCEKAIDLDPQLGLAYGYRGLWNARKGNKDKVMPDFDKAIQLAPKEAAVYNARGAAQVNVELALADHTKAIELAPRFPIYYTNRASNYISRQSYDLAIKDASEAIKLSPKLALAHSRRGEAHYYKGTYDDALTDLKEAIRHDPTHSDAFHFRGLIHRARKKYTEAIADFTETIRLAPRSGGTYRQRGLTHFDMGNTQLAINDFTEALKISPDYGEYYIERAIAYNRLAKYEPAKYEDAKRDCQKALKVKLTGDQARFEVYFEWGYACSGTRDYEIAIRHYEEALRYKPKNAPSHYNMGLAFLSLKRGSDAVVSFTKAIENNRSGAAKYYMMRSQAHVLNNNDLPKARADYDTAVGLDASLKKDHPIRP